MAAPLSSMISFSDFAARLAEAEQPKPRSARTLEADLAEENRQAGC